MRLPGAAHLLSLGLLPAALLAADYHVDSQTGDDAREGLTPDTAWRTLEKVNAATFKLRNTLIEFNLSHDNEGGFLLICTPGKRKLEENLGNLGTIARYNISRHDRARTFHVSAAENTRVHDNAVYIRPGHDVQAVLLSDWSGWAKGLEFRNNLFHSEGVARYGHETGRTEGGAFALGPGWGPATGVVFRGNRYVGRHENRPEEGQEASAAAPLPIRFDDWPGPQFDPRQPERFDTYLQAHRVWMLRLMDRQFGRQPGLAK